MEMSIGSIVVLSILGLIALIMLPSTLVITQQKTSKILTKFGRYYGCTNPGLSTKPPWPFVVQRDKLDLNIQELKGDVTVKSLDNAFLTVPWSLQYQVMPDKIKEAYYELDDPRGQMKSYLLNTLRGEASQLTMDQLFKSNASFEKAASETLEERFSKYGYRIINVLVDDPAPSKEVRQSFDRVIASLREKEAAKNEADALKIKMVGEAKAEGESLEIKGAAFKKFRKDIADGNSDSIKAFLEDLPDNTLTSRDVLDFFAGVDLRDAIRDASKSKGSMVVVPVDFQNNITLPVPG